MDGIWCEKEIQFSVASKNELRMSCSKETRQKIVSKTNGPLETTWTYEELLDLAPMLHDAPQFRTERFAVHRDLIENLGRTLVHQRDRSSLVDAMLLLMSAWVNICQNDAFCILPPDLATLHDPQQQKVLGLIERLKRGAIEDKTNLAIQRRQNLQGNFQPTPFEEMLQARFDQNLVDLADA